MKTKAQWYEREYIARELFYIRQSGKISRETYLSWDERETKKTMDKEKLMTNQS